MLISTQLATLGDLLRTSKDTMVTRGVASVRSPVCNLQQYKADVGHDAFTQAVVEQFRGEYGIKDEVCYVDESEQFTHVDYISKGLAELPSWDWLYGQTPEFTYTVQQSFSWGTITVHLRSSHGIIRSCSLELSESRLSHDEMQLLASLLRGLEGQKYGFVDLGWGRSEGQQPVTDVVAWLRNVMEN